MEAFNVVAKQRVKLRTCGGYRRGSKKRPDNDTSGSAAAGHQEKREEVAQKHVYADP